jgi:alpha-L-rhamnosidase
MRFALLCLFTLALLQDATAQATDSSRWASGYWNARWIAHPTAPARQYGVYHFRKSITLTAKPLRFLVHVSADNRYRLFVNGRAVGMGPARSDLQNWHYETIDLAPYLTAGVNVLAAQVWFLNESAPLAQISYQAGFIVQGDTPTEAVANTDATWTVLRNPAYTPVKNDMARLHTYVVVGDGDRVNGNLYPWGWAMPDYPATAAMGWVAARPLWFSAKTRTFGTDGNWALVPRTIPPMETGRVRLARVRRTEGVTVPTGFLTGNQPVTVSAKTRAVLLFDQNELTNAYPELTVSGGKDAVLTLAYAEGLVDDKGQKGNRNEIDGRHLLGIEDQFVADGGSRRTFRPLWFRTYRYLQLTVETGAEPLTINDLSGEFTGYPFALNARFDAPADSSLARIWAVGWRTARLCAGETYFDCPYYEQLQYTGDTRIQALISLYLSGDDRLMRKAILDYDHSRFNDGLTQSRYPSNDFQVIPTFSLFWVCMVHDYWRHRTDDALIQQMLPGILGVLDWHESRLADTGLNGPMPWWNFVDWCWPWNETERTGGVPPGTALGGSSVLTLQQAYTYDRAADLLAHYGKNERAEHYRDLARRLCKAVYATCYDTNRGLLADTPTKKTFSQHANILAVLTDAVPTDQQAALLQRAISEGDKLPATITPATFYFKFYLFEALKKTGLGDQFGAQLAPWRGMLALGLTTFAEQPEPTRSDCHAWSASPVYEMLSLVCGISPAEPGFRSVNIEPSLGTLPTVSGRMPHPNGMISVQFAQTPAGALTGTIDLPKDLSGTLRWHGKTLALKPGKQAVQL